MTNTTTSQPQKQTFADTLTGLYATLTKAPAGPIQQLVRRTFAKDDLLENTEYELRSAKGTLESLFQSAQTELFKVMGENAGLGFKLDSKKIQYQTTDNSTPIVVHFDLEDVFNGYDLTASNQPQKAKQVSQFQLQIQQLQQEYVQLAQDLENQKVQRTYLTLKTQLHGITSSESKTDVEQYQDEVSSLLKADEKQKEAAAEETRATIAAKRIIEELKQGFAQSSSYNPSSLVKIMNAATTEDVQAIAQYSAKSIVQAIHTTEPVQFSPDSKKVLDIVMRPYFESTTEKDALDWFINARYLLHEIASTQTPMEYNPTDFREGAKYSLYLALNQDPNQFKPLTLALAKTYETKRPDIAKAITGELDKAQ